MHNRQKPGAFALPNELRLDDVIRLAEYATERCPWYSFGKRDAGGNEGLIGRRTIQCRQEYGQIPWAWDRFSDCVPLNLWQVDVRTWYAERVRRKHLATARKPFPAAIPQYDLQARSAIAPRSSRLIAVGWWPAPCPRRNLDAEISESLGSDSGCKSSSQPKEHGDLLARMVHYRNADTAQPDARSQCICGSRYLKDGDCNCPLHR